MIDISTLRKPSETVSNRRSRSASWFVLLPTSVTIVWLCIVLEAGLWLRVVSHWEAALTMMFGSFLAGSSPEGGGAVAFPVFTKAMGVPSPVARTFGLCIQAVGMSMATASILVSRRPIHRRAALLGASFGTLGFGLTMALLGNHGQPFWPLSIGTPWVKATFSIVLAATSVLVLRLRAEGPASRVLEWNHRLDAGFALAAGLGGMLSAFAGTGANMIVFVFLVAFADVEPKEALATAIAVMASVSVVGLLLLGVIDGQLYIELVGDRVTAVGNNEVDLLASQTDLFGLWFAAVPVVVWGAPLGSIVATRLPERTLLTFVALLAMFEVLTTAVLVTEIRTDKWLAAYLVLGVIGLPGAWLWLRRHRYRIFNS